MKYKKYPKYKDSGVEWIGEIPEGWEIKKIKFLTKIISSTIDKKQNPVDKKVRVVNYNDVVRNNFIDSNKVDYGYCSESEYNSYSLTNGDILYTKDSMDVGNIFDVCLIRTTKDLVFGYHLSKISIFNSDIVPEYLFYFLSQKSIKDYLLMLSVGVTIKGLSNTAVKNTRVVLPSLSEAIQISDFLEKQTTQFDELIAKSKAQITLLEEKKQATINQAVTRGLDPSVPMKDSGVEWIGDIPEGWEVKRLKHIIKFGTSITYGIVQAGPHIKNGIPYIRTGDMKHNFLPKDGLQKTSKEIDNNFRRSKVFTGDLVVAIRATVGKVLPVPDYLDGANLTQGTAKISPNSQMINNFVLYALRSMISQDQFNSIMKGATFKEITLEALRNFLIVVPPKDEQKQIVESLDKQTTQFDELIAKSKAQITLLEEKRQALITAAVTGKIDVRGIAV